MLVGACVRVLVGAKMKIRFGDFSKQRRECHIEKHDDESNEVKGFHSGFTVVVVRGSGGETPQSRDWVQL